MQICQNHWHDVKNAIRQRGLWKLIAHDGYIAAPVVTEETNEKTLSVSLDPLRATGLMISDQALAAFGRHLLSGNFCPLCAVDENLGDAQAMQWIDADADLILEVCRARHLVSIDDF